MACRPVALVTGGAQRLGEAIVRHLSRRGYDVVLHFNTNADRAAVIAAECQIAFANRVVPLQADLLDDDAMMALFDHARNAVEGREVSLLVNNASLFEPDSLLNATLGTWRRAVRTNLEAPYFLTQAFARQWLVHSDDEPTAVARLKPGTAAVLDGNGEVTARGLVINMVDQRVLKLTPQFASYTIGKAGLWDVTVTSAQALAPHVRVNAIGPGPTLQGERQSVEHFGKQRRAVPLQRGAHAADILRALDYLIDSPAVTGQLMCVDGGQHLAWTTPDTAVPE